MVVLYLSQTFKVSLFGSLESSLFLLFFFFPQGGAKTNFEQVVFVSTLRLLEQKEMIWNNVIVSYIIYV